jgi:hypothetical protein
MKLHQKNYQRSDFMIDIQSHENIEFFRMNQFNATAFERFLEDEMMIS